MMMMMMMIASGEDKINELALRESVKV